MSALSAQAASRMKSSSWRHQSDTSARPAGDIVVSVAALKRIAPDFSAGSAIITTSDAALRHGCGTRPSDGMLVYGD